MATEGEAPGTGQREQLLNIPVTVTATHLRYEIYKAALVRYSTDTRWVGSLLRTSPASYTRTCALRH